MNYLRARRREKVRTYIIIFTILSIPLPIFLFLTCGAKSYQKWEDLDFNSNLSYVYVTSMKEDIEGPYHIRIDKEDDYRCEHYFVVEDDHYIIPIFYLDIDNEAAHKYMKAKKKYLTGTISEEELAKKRVSSIGRISKVGKYDYIADLEKYLSEDPRYSQGDYQIVPYVMQCEDPGSVWLSILVFFILEMIPVMAIILCRIRAVGPIGEKTINQYIKEMGNSPILRKKIDTFFSHSEILPGFWLNEEYIAGLYNTNVIFGELRQVVSMYKMMPVDYAGNVAADLAVNLTSSPGNIQIQFSNQKKYLLQLNSEEDADAVLEQIQSICAWIKTIPDVE